MSVSITPIYRALRLAINGATIFSSKKLGKYVFNCNCVSVNKKAHFWQMPSFDFAWKYKIK